MRLAWGEEKYHPSPFSKLPAMLLEEEREKYQPRKSFLVPRGKDHQKQCFSSGFFRVYCLGRRTLHFTMRVPILSSQKEMNEELEVKVFKKERKPKEEEEEQIDRQRVRVWWWWKKNGKFSWLWAFSIFRIPMASLFCLYSGECCGNI
ncbi:hypothetical protein AVEN_258429-1 [Araneus ventricosus]|uniref:Uncharacterized protein n=1 Tax=Araneus ventricosus TaxID=182803 RepID=A0A4Y2DJW4_ARAVE|nr:hypothetical protein AVEN_258429-1 [Araneus ventricosus]